MIFLGDEKDLTKEYSKNLSILEHVLGKQVQPPTREDMITEFRKNQVSKKASTSFSTVLAPRFDPLKEDSKRFELQNIPGKSDRKLNIDFDELDRRDEEAKKIEIERKRKANLKGPLRPSGQIDDVESFYEVNANLKDAFGDSGDFVFDNLFQDKTEIRQDIHAQNEAAEEVILESKKKTFGKEKNPFKYDSSDEDDDEPEMEKGEIAENESQPELKTKIEILSQDKAPPTSGPGRKERKRTSVIEFTGFFFKKNDPRLEQATFWNEDLVKKAKDDSGNRRERMRIALGLRKKAAQKNVQLRKRIEKKRMLLTPKQFQATMVNQKRIRKGRKFKRPFRSNRK